VDEILCASYFLQLCPAYVFLCGRPPRRPAGRRAVVKRDGQTAFVCIHKSGLPMMDHPRIENSEDAHFSETLLCTHMRMTAVAYSGVCVCLCLCICVCVCVCVCDSGCSYQHSNYQSRLGGLPGSARATQVESLQSPGSRRSSASPTADVCVQCVHRRFSFARTTQSRPSAPVPHPPCCFRSRARQCPRIVKRSRTARKRGSTARFGWGELNANKPKSRQA